MTVTTKNAGCAITQRTAVGWNDVSQRKTHKATSYGLTVAGFIASSDLVVSVCFIEDTSAYFEKAWAFAKPAPLLSVISTDVCLAILGARWVPKKLSLNEMTCYAVVSSRNQDIFKANGFCFGLNRLGWG